MYKTGTTSLGLAFEQLGLRTFHGGKPVLDLGMDGFSWSSEAFASQRQQICNLVKLYDAFEDFPFMWIYREMHEDFPDARFVLLERDSSKVAQSDINMWKQLGRSPVPPAQAFIDRYERHREAVLNYFGDSDQLLVMRLGTGNEWEELSDFLQLPKPLNCPFPRANVRSYGVVARYLYRLGRRLSNIVRT